MVPRAMVTGPNSLGVIFRSLYGRQGYNQEDIRAARWAPLVWRTLGRKDERKSVLGREGDGERERRKPRQREKERERDRQ